MDEISLLRRARSDVAERAPEDIARGRAALFRAIEDQSPFATFAGFESDALYVEQRARRRRRFSYAGLSAVGAASIVAALVATNLFGVGAWRGGADPAAADALNSAALAALEVSDPVVGPGQFLRVRTDAVYAAMGNLEADAEWARQHNNGELSGVEMTSFLETYRSELHIPADRAGDWFYLQCLREPFQTFGPRSETYAAELAAEAAKYESSEVVSTLPGGQLYGGDPFGGYYNGTTDISDDWDALPRDPRELLDTIYRFEAGAGQSRDGQALVWIADTLRGGTVPAETRAAMYRAAALIPGVEITEQQATLNGSTGIAIGRVETVSDFRQDIIVDPATGQFIGERRVHLSEVADIPAGTAAGWTAVTTTVVDAAPTDASACDAP